MVVVAGVNHYIVVIIIIIIKIDKNIHVFIIFHAPYWNVNFFSVCDARDSIIIMVMV